MARHPHLLLMTHITNRCRRRPPNMARKLPISPPYTMTSWQHHWGFVDGGEQWHDASRCRRCWCCRPSDCCIFGCRGRTTVISRSILAYARHRSRWCPLFATLAAGVSGVCPKSSKITGKRQFGLFSGQNNLLERQIVMESVSFEPPYQY